MVFLHQVERQAQDVRPTDDVDVVVDLRAEPKALQRIHETLLSDVVSAASNSVSERSERRGAGGNRTHDPLLANVATRLK